VLLAELHAQPLATIERAPIFEEIGEEQIYVTLDDALDRARAHMDTRAPTPIAPIPAASKPEH
jgi:hypothetical protein